MSDSHLMVKASKHEYVHLTKKGKIAVHRWATRRTHSHSYYTDVLKKLGHTDACFQPLHPIQSRRLDSDHTPKVHNMNGWWHLRFFANVDGTHGLWTYYDLLTEGPKLGQGVVLIRDTKHHNVLLTAKVADDASLSKGLALHVVVKDPFTNNVRLRWTGCPKDRLHVTLNYIKACLDIPKHQVLHVSTETGMSLDRYRKASMKTLESVLAPSERVRLTRVRQGYRAEGIRAYSCNSQATKGPQSTDLESYSSMSGCMDTNN